MIQSLQSLRGIFAIFIFLFHFALNGKSVMPSGGVSGVAFFIMLSGFVMCAGYENKVLSDNFKIKKYIIQRIKRIYPLHLIGFALWAILISRFQPSSLMKISSNLMLMQSWIPDLNFSFSCNGVSWCLSVLLFCYVCFPFILKSISNFYLKGQLFMITFAIFAYFMICDIIPHNYIHWAIYVNPIMRLADFIIGIFLWRIYSNLRKLNISHNVKVATFIQTLAVIIIIGFMFYYDSVPERYSFVSYWWLPSAGIILVYALFDNVNTIINKCLKTKILLGLGNISFSFYIFHQLIITTWGLYSNRWGLPNNNLVILVCLFVFTIILSYLTYEYIESKIFKFNLKYITERILILKKKVI